MSSTDAYYRLFRDGSQISVDYATGGTVTESSLADGTYAYTLRSVDTAGNVSSVSPVLNVTIDTAAPSITTAASFHYDAATQRITCGFSEDVSGSLTAADWTLQNLTTGSPVPAASMTVDFDSGTNTAALRFPGYTSGILPDGDYQATLLATGVSDAAGNPLAAGSSLDFFFLQADASRDRRVNTLDFNILAGNFGGSGKVFSQGDFNYSGLVDSVDFGILVAQYGKSLDAEDEGLPSISGLIARYDADALGLANGASVPTWMNAQGNHGLDLVASGIAPTYIAATDDHRAGVQFGFYTEMGSLNNLGLSGDPDFTVFFAGRVTALAAGYNHPWSWGNGAEGGHPGGCADFEIETTGSGPRVDFATGWGSDGMTPDGSMPMNSDVLVTFAKPAGPINTVKIWIDQVAQSVTGSPSIPSILDTPFYLGPTVHATQSPEMVVNEVLIYDRVLSDAEVASVHSYLASEREIAQIRNAASGTPGASADLHAMNAAAKQGQHSASDSGIQVSQCDKILHGPSPLAVQAKQIWTSPLFENSCVENVEAAMSAALM